MVWKLPETTPDQPHGYKYRYYYGKDGMRLVDYDNESGKGDHKHIGTHEYPYAFTSLEQLTKDFLLGVQSSKNEEAANDE